ncbi:zinc finger protein ZFP2 isoform X2 [Bactrocera dorsalis]|uniref:Zinc finger protein ZFP2 isoform X2 n=1 Tax=Bactrocera dorsalis TaxID=27457 RepID=A0A6I9W7Q6_BACDO|nr:zinc finger protein ZFP2 isoform X2 [Bactrocera dorsalis]
MVLTSERKYFSSESHIDEGNTLVQNDFMLTNDKCFLCDRDFVEGEDTFLIFEMRLREDGGIDNPLSLVLATALGRELNEINSHSNLLCLSCNTNILEFEKLLHNFCELRIKIIKAYNRTVQIYNIDPILIDGENEISRIEKPELSELIENIMIDELHSKTLDGNSTECQNESLGSFGDDTAEAIETNVLVNTELTLDDSVVDLIEELTDSEEMITESKLLNIETQYEAQSESSQFNNYSGIIANLTENPQQDLMIFHMQNADSRISEPLIHSVDQEPSICDPDENYNSSSTINCAITTDNPEDVNVVTANAQIKMVFEQVNNLYFCLLCEEQKTMAPEAFAEHMLKNHGLSFYSCEICSAGFLSIESIKEHIESMHSNLSSTKQVENSEYQCEECQEVFSDNQLLRVHKRTHSNVSLQYECSECQKRYSCRRMLLDHMNMHTGSRPYKCTKCSKDFASKYTLQGHMKIHSERVRPYKCDKCNKAFLNQQTFTHHKKLHMGEKSFICDICSKTFSTQHNLDVHKIVHTGQRPFICRTCGKSFARRAEIKDHERIHTGEKPYKCDMCDAAFAQRSNLMTHRKSTHLNEKLHRCDQCDRSFKRRRLLQYHINAVHTGVRPHECEICGSSFVYPEHKKKHMLIHGNTKPYTCEICGKEFNSCANRNAHRYVHSTKKPYECLKCGAGFMRKPLLLAHMKLAQHTNDTIIINQPHISDKRPLNSKREISLVDLCNETNDVPANSNSQDSNSSDDKALQLIAQHTEDVAEVDSVQYLQFDDLDKDGHQIITWVDIGRDKDHN